jgi:uncharacterized membrane protein YbhN (UPF0104 family)
MNTTSDPGAGARDAAENRQARHGIRSKPWWPWVKRSMKFAFFALVAYLLISQARSVEWEKVLATMRQRPAHELLLAAAPAVASFLLYSCFDLLGRHYTGHGLSARKVVTVNFISYAFNLNLGALIGGVAFRYRLYSRLGLDTATITRVLSLSMLTNWLGYMFLAGLVFWWWPIPLPPDWKLDTQALRMLGLALLAVPIAYILLCALSRRRTWTFRGHEATLPSLRLALLQLLMSSINWSLMACALFLLMDQKIAYPTVLGVLLLGAIAGVITHVPAGLGVLEAVFYALLSHQLPETELLAALLTYRVIYYLAPLLVATVLYLIVEARAKSGAGKRGVR